MHVLNGVHLFKVDSSISCLGNTLALSDDSRKDVIVVKSVHMGPAS
jgi:hypothetical protein